MADPREENGIITPTSTTTSFVHLILHHRLNWLSEATLCLGAFYRWASSNLTHRLNAPFGLLPLGRNQSFVLILGICSKILRKILPEQQST